LNPAQPQPVIDYSKSLHVPKPTR